nr:class I SAM-dependent methyltransferase [Pseudonocardiales bacterium]
MTRTIRLTLGADGRVRQRIPPDELSNDLAGWIADDLVAPGLIPPSAFERTFVSVVGSSW